MRATVAAVSLFLLGIVSQEAFSNEQPLDLAVGAGSNDFLDIDGPQDLILGIRNSLPGRDYRITTKQNVYDVPGLDSTGFKKKDVPKSDPNVAGAVTSPCKELDTAIDVLLDLDDESKVQEKAETVNKALAEARKHNTATAEAGGRCKPDALDKAEKLVKTAEFRPLRKITVKPGDSLTSTVTRTDDNKRWEWMIETPPPGSFETTVALLLLENKGESFHTVDAGGGQFRIEERDAADYNFVPAIIFHWVESQKKSDAFNWSMAGGLGIDLDNPTALLGFTGVYHRNLAFHFGMYINKANRLAGGFKEGQTVAQSLPEDSLIEKEYNFGLYAGFGYRFNSSPF